MNPADKYEASIFLSTPSIYWLSLLVSLFIGFYFVIESYFKNLFRNSALILLFIAYISFLSLWIIRGYYLWCAGDPLTHLGWIKDTLLTGHTSEDIIYPITHIFLAQIATIFNIDPIIPHKYIPLLFGILYILFMYQFAKSVLPDKLSTIIILLLSFVPMQKYYLQLTPNHLSNLLLPLAFFVFMNYMKNRNYQWCILILIIIFLYPAFHPVPSIALLIMIISLTPPFITFVKKIMVKSFYCKGEQINNNNNVMLGVILLILIITWISSFYVWEKTIQNFYMFMTEGGTTQLDILTDNVVYASSYGYSVISQFFKVYGGVLIYLILTLIGCILLWKKAKEDNNVYLKYQRLIWLITPASISVLIMGFMYLTNIGFGAGRFEAYIILFLIMFVGYVISELIRIHLVSNKLIRISISLFLVGLFIIAAPNIYPSPYTWKTNLQVPRTDMIGMKWFISKKDDNTNFTANSISQPDRYAHVLLFPKERSIINIPRTIPRLPYHFGYDQNSNLGDYYEENIYMVLNYRDQIYYKEVFPEIEHLRFTGNDFDNLKKDDSLTKIYDNGGFDSYYIHNSD